MTAPLRFYLCGRYGRRDTLAAVARTWETRNGWQCTSRWLFQDDAPDLGPDDDFRLQRKAAEGDLHDIDRADAVVAFTEPPGVPGAQRGGRHVELGYALATDDKRIVIVGPKENIFCALADAHRGDAEGAEHDLLRWWKEKR